MLPGYTGPAETDSGIAEGTSWHQQTIFPGSEGPILDDTIGKESTWLFCLLLPLNVSLVPYIGRSQLAKNKYFTRHSPSIKEQRIEWWIGARGKSFIISSFQIFIDSFLIENLLTNFLKKYLSKGSKFHVFHTYSFKSTIFPNLRSLPPVLSLSFLFLIFLLIFIITCFQFTL